MSSCDPNSSRSQQFERFSPNGDFESVNSDIRVKSARLAHGSKTGTWVRRARLGWSSLLNTCFDQGAVWGLDLAPQGRIAHSKSCAPSQERTRKTARHLAAAPSGWSATRTERSEASGGSRAIVRVARKPTAIRKQALVGIETVHAFGRAKPNVSR